MKKQVILSKEEYDTLVKLACMAAILNNNYIEKEMGKSNEHPMDRNNADSKQKAIFSALLWLDDELKVDMQKCLYDDFQEKKLAVWNDEDIFE